VTPASEWLAQPRADAAVEQILAAAGRLFAEQGPGSVAMGDIADAAGCSRATLYRYFENRRALQTAFAHRQALEIVEVVTSQVAGSADGAERAVDAVLLTLDEVRSRPMLKAWISPENTAELLAILRDSPLVETLTARLASTGRTTADLDLARWILRSIVSLLALPPSDRTEERRLVERFIAPLLTSSGAPVTG
jgi:AcrR family transcriptional regulator